MLVDDDAGDTLEACNSLVQENALTIEEETPNCIESRCSLRRDIRGGGGGVRDRR